MRFLSLGPPPSPATAGRQIFFKKGAEDCAARYASQYPDSKVEIKVNVYDEMEYRYFKEVGC